MMIADLLAQAKQKLPQSATPQLDAEVLLAHVLKVPRVYLFAHPEKRVSFWQRFQFKRLLRARQKGMPIAYLIKHKEFWSLDFEVNSAVLIPRPDTELLVETALQFLGKEKSLTIADLGTGSGIIAVTLGHECPHWKITATDVSKRALNLAKKNALKNSVKNIMFIQSDWFSKLQPHAFDAIVSNPPYVDANDGSLLQKGVCFEPAKALIAKDHGLQAIRHIISHAQKYLREGGWLFIEHGCEQGQDVRRLFEQHGYDNIQTQKDLAERDRVTFALSRPR
jgi:release factor glutamine methyltransferase